MILETQAIVLHAFKYGEKQLIVDLLTSECGRVSALCRVPAGRGGGLRRQLLQPLTMLDVQLDHRPSRSLQRLRGAQMRNPFCSIPFAPDKIAIALFVAEFLLHATRGEQQANRPLFAYVEASVLWLDAATKSYANFHLVFTMRLAQFVGFSPNTEDYHAGDFFDLRQGSFCSLSPLHRDFLRPDDAAAINTLLRMDYGNMHLFRLTREERNRICAIIISYYQLHVDAFPQLKSLKVLQELFC